MMGVEQQCLVLVRSVYPECAETICRLARPSPVPWSVNLPLYTVVLLLPASAGSGGWFRVFVPLFVGLACHGFANLPIVW